MHVAFILKLEISDVSAIPGTAEDLEQDLTNAGHDVISCVPWARPTAPTLANPLLMPQSPSQPPLQ